MKAKYAREIRRGIMMARDVLARRRVERGISYEPNLEERAYGRTIIAARSRTRRPPRGKSGGSR